MCCMYRYPAKYFRTASCNHVCHRPAQVLRRNPSSQPHLHRRSANLHVPSQPFAPPLQAISSGSCLADKVPVQLSVPVQVHVPQPHRVFFSCAQWSTPRRKKCTILPSASASASPDSPKSPLLLASARSCLNCSQATHPLFPLLSYSLTRSLLFARSLDLSSPVIRSNPPFRALPLFSSPGFFGIGLGPNSCSPVFLTPYPSLPLTSPSVSAPYSCFRLSFPTPIARAY
ncbi:hypothetical protein V8C42DRAFT_268328 [Trichoderma barbatum]